MKIGLLNAGADAGLTPENPDTQSSLCKSCAKGPKGSKSQDTDLLEDANELLLSLRSPELMGLRGPFENGGRDVCWFESRNVLAAFG